MQLILLGSSGASTTAPSKHGAMWWHWCISQPALPDLRVRQHSRGVTPCAHQHKEGGWCGNVLLVNPPFFPVFTCLLVQPGQCPVRVCPAFP